MDDLRDPDNQFDSLDSFSDYSPSFCGEELTTPKAYITAEFGAELLPESMVFVVGGEGEFAPNDRSDTYTNGLLCHGKVYTFFVRAYPDLGSQVL